MKKILITDDEPHVLRVLKLSLEKEGYEVDTCANGMEALARIERQHPDVLITDIQMPLMTGEELCRHIEEYMPERSFLIFVLTSRTEIDPRPYRTVLSLAIPSSITFVLIALETGAINGFLAHMEHATEKIAAYSTPITPAPRTSREDGSWWTTPTQLPTAPNCPQLRSTNGRWRWRSSCPTRRSET